MKTSGTARRRGGRGPRKKKKAKKEEAKKTTNKDEEEVGGRIGSSTPSDVVVFSTTTTTRERVQRLFPCGGAAAALNCAQKLNADKRQPCAVYLLASVGASTATYIGATVDTRHRLRQHCGVLKGGGAPKNKHLSKIWDAAAAAGAAGAARDQWHMIRFVTGIPTWREALRIEWKWKKLSKGGSSLAARLRALDALLALPSATKIGMKYADYASNGGWWPRVEGPLHLADCK